MFTQVVEYLNHLSSSLRENTKYDPPTGNQTTKAGQKFFLGWKVKPTLRGPKHSPNIMKTPKNVSIYRTEITEGASKAVLSLIKISS